MFKGFMAEKVHGMRFACIHLVVKNLIIWIFRSNQF